MVNPIPQQLLGVVKSRFNRTLLGTLIVRRPGHPLAYTEVDSRLHSCRLLQSLYEGRLDYPDYLVSCGDICSTLNSLSNSGSQGDILLALLYTAWEKDGPTLISRLEDESVAAIAAEWVSIVCLVTSCQSTESLTQITEALLLSAVELERMIGVLREVRPKLAALDQISTYPEERLHRLLEWTGDVPPSAFYDPVGELRKLVMEFNLYTEVPTPSGQENTSI